MLYASNATLAVNNGVPNKEPLGQRWAEFGVPEMKGRHGKQGETGRQGVVHVSLAKSGEGSVIASRKKTPEHSQLEDLCFNMVHNSTRRSEALPDGK